MTIGDLRWAMDNLRTVGVQAKLVIYRTQDGTKTYDILGFDATWTGTGVNRLQVPLATGTGVNPDLQQAGQYSFGRGSPAELWVTIAVGDAAKLAGVTRQGTWCLFRGFVQDLGPASLSFGQFSVVVEISGVVGWLQNCSPQASSIAAGSPFALAPLTTFATTDGAEVGHANRLSTAAGSQKFGHELLRSFISVAAGGVNLDNLSIRALRDIFTTELNEQAAAVLSTVRIQDLGFQPEIPAETRAVIVEDMNGHLMGASGNVYDSFLTAIHTVGSILGFRLIETAAGLTLAPFSPFWARNRVRVKLSPSDYSSVAWATQGNNAYQGLVFVPDGSISPLDTDSPFVGVFVRSGTLPHGQVVAQQAPSFIASIERLALTTSAAPEANTGKSRSVSQAAVTSLGNPLARETCLSMAYGSKTLTVVINGFRTDIGPQTAIEIQFPDNVKNAVQSSIYGSVRDVRVSVDAVNGSCSTVLTIEFPRSIYQQIHDVEIYRPVTKDDHGKYTVGASTGYSKTHPLWADNYYGDRLDEWRSTSGSLAPNSGSDISRYFQ